MITVSIIDDEPKDVERFARAIERAEGFSLLDTYHDCETAIEKIGRRIPDLILLDIELPGMSGVTGAGVFHWKYPDVDIIMLTKHESDEKLFESFSHGAIGYVLKTIQPAHLLEKIREVHNGGAAMSMSVARKLVESFRKQPPDEPLTARENEVLTQLIEGKNNQAIANELSITKNTVKFHIKNILKKFHAANRGDLQRKLQVSLPHFTLHS